MMKKVYQTVLYALLLLSLRMIYSQYDVVHAVDCPALSKVDIAQHVEGKEVTSSEQPLRYGVRLLWNDPINFAPTRVHIYRKKAGEGFEEIGSVNGGIETFLDTKTDRSVPIYIYALQTEFTCGGNTWSKPISVPTLAQFDTTGPYAHVITKDGNSLGEGIWMYLEDLESGIQETSIQIKWDTSPLTKKSYGTPNREFIFVDPTNRDLDSTLTLDAKNGSGAGLAHLYQKTSFPPYTSSGSLLISSPKPGEDVSYLEDALPITFGSSIEGRSFDISISTDLGVHWQNITYHSDEGNPQKITLDLSDITLDRASTLLIDIQEKNGSDILKESLLPLFLIKGGIRGISSSENVPLSGHFNIYNAFTGKKFTPTNLSSEDNGYNGIWENNKAITPSVPYGDYYLRETDDDFYIDSSRFLSPTKETQITFIPKSHYVSSLESTSREDIEILSDKLLPENVVRIMETFKNIVIPTIGSATDNFTHFSEQDFALSTLTCDAATCTKQQFLPKDKTINISYDHTTHSFVLKDGTESKELFTATDQEKNSISIEISSLIHFTLPLPPQSIPLDIEISAVPLVHTPDQYAFAIHFNDAFISYYHSAKILLSADLDCYNALFSRVDNLTNTLTPLPTFCNGISGESLALLPLRNNHIISTIQKQITNFSDIVQDWSSSYMTLFAQWGLFAKETFHAMPHIYISRGELAYMITQAFGIDKGSYGSSGEFQDLPSNHPFAPSILGLYREGIIKGDNGDSTYLRPDDNVNRAEALKMIIAAAEGNVNAHQEQDFTDVHSSDWFYPYVEESYKLGLVEGYTTSNGREFRGGQSITRAEAAKLITTLLRIQITNNL